MLLRFSADCIIRLLEDQSGFGSLSGVKTMRSFQIALLIGVTATAGCGSWVETLVSAGDPLQPVNVPERFGRRKPTSLLAKKAKPADAPPAESTELAELTLDPGVSQSVEMVSIVSPHESSAPLSGSWEYQLGKMGNLLASQLEEKESEGLKIRFHVLHNPRPKIHHTSAGDIFVTDGMMAGLSSQQELAAVLAPEIAQLVEEYRERPRGVEDSAQAIPQNSLHADPAERLSVATPKVSHDRVQQLASDLLARSGFEATLPDPVPQEPSVPGSSPILSN